MIEKDKKVEKHIWIRKYSLSYELFHKNSHLWLIFFDKFVPLAWIVPMKGDNWEEVAHWSSILPMLCSHWDFFEWRIGLLK